ncbi:MAG: hypothetical protein AAFQ94_20125 [Bacteroidota bacterium]
MKSNNTFWPAYSDLMTSLFFVMLVLYVITFVLLRNKQNEYRVAAEKYDKLQEIEQSLSSLDQEYFDYDQVNKRFRMTSEINFAKNSNAIPAHQKRELRNAGAALFRLMQNYQRETPNVSYLIILEGNTARAPLLTGQMNYIAIPDVGFKLSYERALALYNFWKDSGYDFKSLGNCEILIAGSGYFGKSRDKTDESNNRRFTIQITGKLGEFQSDR